MLINPLKNVLEKIIFDLQITIPRVHPVQFSSRLTPKMPEKSNIGAWSLLTARTRFFPDMCKIPY